MTRHVHADLYEEAVNDTSIKWQMMYGDKWVDIITPLGGVVFFRHDRQYRKKPREFQEGHWYQCVGIDGYNSVHVFHEDRFYRDTDFACGGCDVVGFKWIGKSLGELKFG